MWQAFPIEHGRTCYQAYTGMNVTCTPPSPDAAPTFMGGGMRSAPPDPAFRTDYGFATADAADPAGGWMAYGSIHPPHILRISFT